MPTPKQITMTSEEHVKYQMVACLTVNVGMSRLNTVNVLTTMSNMSLGVSLLPVLVYLCMF